MLVARIYTLLRAWESRLYRLYAPCQAVRAEAPPCRRRYCGLYNGSACAGFVAKVYTNGGNTLGLLGTP